MTFEVMILGSNGAVPAYNRHPSSQAINYNGHIFLVDCGEATQFQMNKFGLKRGRLDHIFISHLHGDHYFGIAGLITSFNLNWRTNPLHLYAPEGLQDILNTHFRHSETTLRFDLYFHPIKNDEPRVIYEDSTMQVETIILKHRLPTTGFIFREKQHLRHIIPEKLDEYRIPRERILDIKRGDDFITDDKQRIPNSELTLDASPGRSYAYCSDTAFTESFAEQIKGVNLLYHEATFMEEHAERAGETFHSTAKQAARVAKMSEAKQLLLGHFSARYENLEAVLNEAKEIFPNCHLAEEGKIFEII